MTHKRTLRTRIPNSEITDNDWQDIRHVLSDGLFPSATERPYPFLGIAPVYHPSPYEFWPELRDEILTSWSAAHPFTRPQAWWMFDAPRSLVEGSDRFVQTLLPNETQAAFLIRHDLLTDDERNHLVEHDPTFKEIEHGK